MSRLRRSTSLFVALLLAAAPACTPRRDTDAPGEQRPSLQPTAEPRDAELDQRLARLTERLEAARVEHHVPGMAVAVVKNDELVFAQGFGYADVESKTPADEHTMFAIGSSTKAFTSALVGTFVDEGKLDWDDPIEKHLPEMKLAVRRTDRQPTLRDAMSHRTGFTRMGPLWAGGKVTPEVMFATASKAEPWADYGKTFLYNNVVFASAGEAASRAGGKPWAQLVTERILEPLGMESSNASVKQARDHEARAQGYRYDDARDTFEPVPMRDLDLIGPAGAINSTVVDMAQWLRLQLSRGEVDGKRILSKESIEATWSPQIEAGGGAKYGLGWFVRDWNGHRVVEHGGNIDGYAAQVALLPDDGLGYVLLTNVSATRLQSASRGIVWEAMLGSLEDEDEGEDAKLPDVGPYLGKYVADFGPWDDARFTVSAQGGKLFLDVPMQTNYELLPPDGNGKWKFAMAPEIAASFETVEDGKAKVLRLHQGGVDFEMPREGWTPPPEIELDDYRGHLGRYASEDGKGSATVLVQGNRLAVDIPGQMVYELHKPDEDGKWRFRVKGDIAVQFERGKPGKRKKRGKKSKSDVVALVIHQGDTKTRMVRKGAPPKIPTRAEVAELRRAAAREDTIAGLGLMEAKGKVRFAQSGIEGTIHIVFDGARYRNVVDLGPFGTTIEVHNGKRAWTEGTLGPVEEVHGKYIDQVAQDHPLAMVRSLDTLFESVEVETLTEVDGAPRIRATLRNGELPPTEVLLDPKTGDVVRVRTSRLLPSLGAALPVKSEFSDYRDVSGLRMPHHLESENMPSGRTVVDIDSIGPSKADPATVFPDGPPPETAK